LAVLHSLHVNIFDAGADLDETASLQFLLIKRAGDSVPSGSGITLQTLLALMGVKG
jgi:hypothetical protein